MDEKEKSQVARAKTRKTYSGMYNYLLHMYVLEYVLFINFKYA